MLSVLRDIKFDKLIEITSENMQTLLDEFIVTTPSCICGSKLPNKYHIPEGIVKYSMSELPFYGPQVQGLIHPKMKPN